MASFSRVSVEAHFQPGESRLKLGALVAKGLDLVVGQDIEMVAFLRQAGELLCLPVTAITRVGTSPLLTLLSLEAAHADSDLEIPSLEAVPASRELVGPDRLVRFQLKWAKNGQFDLQLHRDTAALLGRTESQAKVRVITWKGWLVLMSHERYTSSAFQAW